MKLPKTFRNPIRALAIALVIIAGSTAIFATISFILKFGGTGSADGQLLTPRGMATDASNNVYVADNGNNRIQKFNSTGGFITKWGSAGAGNGQFSSPAGISVNSSGTVFVADSGNNRIQSFSSTGTFNEAFGTAGSGDGQF